MTTRRHHPRYWLERKAQRKTGYPLATLAYYGPDATRASKAVVGMMASAQAPDVTILQTWHADQADLRTDPNTIEQILAVLDHHHIQRVAMVDRIIGCPHEEGIDYPEGGDCPQCPYWADRDRWTGEPTK